MCWKRSWLVVLFAWASKKMNESSRRYKKFHIDVCWFWLSYLVPYQAKKGRKQLPCRLNGKMLTVFFLITKVSFNTILLGIDVAALILSTKKGNQRNQKLNPDNRKLKTLNQKPKLLNRHHAESRTKPAESETKLSHQNRKLNPADEKPGRMLWKAFTTGLASLKHFTGGVCEMNCLIPCEKSWS